MSEWFKEHAWKACVRLRVPWVRIPPSPPTSLRFALVVLAWLLEPPNLDGNSNFRGPGDWRPVNLVRP